MNNPIISSEDAAAALVRLGENATAADIRYGADDAGRKLAEVRLFEGNWNHLFGPGNAETECRIVVDVVNDTLVAAQAHDGLKWFDLSSAERADLAESLFDANDVCKNPGDWALVEIDGLPNWAQPEKEGKRPEIGQKFESTDPDFDGRVVVTSVSADRVFYEGDADGSATVSEFSKAYARVLGVEDVAELEGVVKSTIIRLRDIGDQKRVDEVVYGWLANTNLVVHEDAAETLSGYVLGMISRARQGLDLPTEAEVRVAIEEGNRFAKEHNGVFRAERTLHVVDVDALAGLGAMLESGKTVAIAPAGAKLTNEAPTLRDEVQTERSALLNPDFGFVRDKRMSELTPAQRADALELWIREQIGWMPDYHQKHYQFLLKRLDETREAGQVAVHSKEPVDRQRSVELASQLKAIVSECASDPALLEACRSSLESIAATIQKHESAKSVSAAPSLDM
jgi:hypothetical protein